MRRKPGNLHKARADRAFAHSKPLARSQELVIEELQDELLVYDQTNHRAHCLGATAASVWRGCDGETTVDALSARLDLDAKMVARALEELRDCDLLDFDSGASRLGNGMTRRDLTFRAAKVGAVAAAAPLIWSVTAPVPAAAATPTPEQCGEYNANSCRACCRIIGCCCCCEGGGGGTEASCKLCYPTALCDAFTCPSANPPQYDSHCSCVGGDFEPGTVTCSEVAPPGQADSCGCSYVG